MYSIRSNWSSSATMLLLRCGPSYNAHSHKDAGSFTLFADGREFLPDSGCYTYTGIKEMHPKDSDRAYFQSTAAHNTLTLNNENAHIPSLENGPFKQLKGYDDCGVISWIPDSPRRHAQLVIENHLTYREPNMTHRRAVFTAGRDAFVVVDEAIGEAAGSVNTHFHLAPTMIEMGLDRLSVYTKFPASSANLLIKGIEQPGLSMGVKKTFVSYSMGQKVKRPALSFQLDKPAGTTKRFITVLALYRGGHPPHVSVQTEASPGSSNYSMAVTIGASTYEVNSAFEPRQMKMSPPAQEFKNKREPQYIKFYQNFVRWQRDDAQLNAQRTCKIPNGLRSSPPPGVECEPPLQLDRIEPDARFSPIVSFKHKYVYCDIPKCGVSRWRRLSRRVEGIPEWADDKAHSPQLNGLAYLSGFSKDVALQTINDPKMYTFIIVRSPYTRLLSGWLDKKDFPRFKLPQTFDAFVHWLQNQTVSKLNEHFKPMTSFCGIGDGMKFDLIARVEEMHEWGPKLVSRLGLTKFTMSGWKGGFFRSSDSTKEELAHNHRSEEKVNKYYTPRLMEVVDTIFHDDFVNFGYEKGKLVY